jgi:hypothetical protein
LNVAHDVRTIRDVNGRRVVRTADPTEIRERRRATLCIASPQGARVEGASAENHLISSLESDSPPLRVMSLMRTSLLIWLVTGATLPSHLTKFT